MKLLFLLCCVSFSFLNEGYASPSTNPDIITRRGGNGIGSGETLPVVHLKRPTGGWTTTMQIPIEGDCSDPTADPLEVNINGTRYYIRSEQGKFARPFPAAPGRNDVTVRCQNKAGVGSASASLTANINPIPFKVVLTGDTDKVYTDLHIYEPKGEHVYWADTKSPTGGMFFLNSEGEDFDQSGYGPYLYIHPSPTHGVYRIDTNYWPGGVTRHTVARLDVIFHEGTPQEERHQIEKALARPDQTETLAYVVIRPNGLTPILYVPGGQNPPPKEVLQFQKEIEPKIKSTTASSSEEAMLFPYDQEEGMRQAVTQLALSQAKQLSVGWEPKQRDCAGLVRFAYREALRIRTADQRKRLNLPKQFLLPVVQTPRPLLARYPDIWEINPSPTGEPQYQSFADAETLIGNNFHRISPFYEQGRPGDLLVYRKSLEAEEPYHLMLLATEGKDALAVYHNGNKGLDGRVRVVRVADLARTDDAAWIPDPHNPHFLGTYQWNRFATKLHSIPMNIPQSQQRITG